MGGGGLVVMVLAVFWWLNDDLMCMLVACWSLGTYTHGCASSMHVTCIIELTSGEAGLTCVEATTDKAPCSVHVRYTSIHVVCSVCVYCILYTNYPYSVPLLGPNTHSYAVQAGL